MLVGYKLLAFPALKCILWSSFHIIFTQNNCKDCTSVSLLDLFIPTLIKQLNLKEENTLHKGWAAQTELH